MIPTPEAFMPQVTARMFEDVRGFGFERALVVGQADTGQVTVLHSWGIELARWKLALVLLGLAVRVLFTRGPA